MNLNPHDRIRELTNQLRSPNLLDRKQALDELATLSPEIAVPVLRSLATENEFGLRRLAVMGLGNHRSEDALQSLQQILDQETDANVIAEAANSLFDFGDAVIPRLQTLFTENRNWLVRQTLIALLPETEHYEVLLDLATQALEDEAQTVRETGILALRKVLQSPLQDQAIGLLSRMAQDSFWRNRWRAATALQGCDLPIAKNLLTQLQQDDHFRVVAAALESSV